MRFLQIAAGSLFELLTQLEIARDQEYLAIPDFEKLFSEGQEIERMLASLIAKLKARGQS